MKLQPLADRIIIKKIEAETKTSTGILLSEGARKQSRTGLVQAVGKDVAEVKAGDQVLYSGYTPIDMDGEEYLIAKEEDILAVVVKGKK